MINYMIYMILNYDNQIEKLYHPENFESFEDYEEYLSLFDEAKELYPELSEKELIEVVDNFLEARNHENN